MLDRRQFVSRSLMTCAAAALPAPLLAAPAKPDWPLGLGDVLEDIPAQSLTRLHGKSPGLAGTLYRNGPARFRRGASAAGHWFDGDGLVRAWRIADGEARLAARFATTPIERGLPTRPQPSAAA